MPYELGPLFVDGTAQYVPECHMVSSVLGRLERILVDLEYPTDPKSLLPK